MKIKGNHLYAAVIFASGVVVIVPAIVGRLANATLHVMAGIAAIETLAMVPLALTVLASLLLMIFALISKERRAALVYGVSALVPILTWCVAVGVNRAGFAAVQGI